MASIRNAVSGQSPRRQRPAVSGFRQIRDELIGDGLAWADELETDKVIEFARLPESPVLKLA